MLISAVNGALAHRTALGNLRLERAAHCELKN
jgi:hypothetical protein